VVGITKKYQIYETSFFFKKNFPNFSDIGIIQSTERQLFLMIILTYTYKIKYNFKIQKYKLMVLFIFL